MSIQIAEQFEENEQFDKAYEEYKKLYEKNPKNMNVIERLGHIAMMLGKKDEAADFYSKTDSKLLQQAIYTVVFNGKNAVKYRNTILKYYATS